MASNRTESSAAGCCLTLWFWFPFYAGGCCPFGEFNLTQSRFGMRSKHYIFSHFFYVGWFRIVEVHHHAFVCYAWPAKRFQV